jgi:hypothetical protein
MEMQYCTNCCKNTGFKRNLGFGTFFMVAITLGWWLLAIPLYPKRCIICGIDKASVVPWYKTGAGILLLAILLLAIIIGLNEIDHHPRPLQLANMNQAEGVTETSKPSSYSESKPVVVDPESPVTQPLPFLVSGDQIVADYIDNEISADSKYNGKHFEVYGLITKVEKADNGKGLVALGQFLDYPPVVAILAYGQDEEAATLHLGHGAFLICSGARKAAHFVVVDDCTVDLTPPTARPKEVRSSPEASTSNLSEASTIQNQQPHYQSWPKAGLNRSLSDALQSPVISPYGPGASSLTLALNGQKQIISIPGNPEACGSGGCPWHLSDASADKDILEELGSLHKMPGTTNGYYDLLIERESSLRIYQYDGDKYKITRCYNRSSVNNESVTVESQCAR